MGKKKRKPKTNWLEIMQTMVSILTGLANIGFIIYQIIKGGENGGGRSSLLPPLKNIIPHW